MFLKRVEISQLRSIDRMALDFTHDASAKGKPGLRKRTLLLGDNGAGKSTVLRAIALVLAGSDALPDLLNEPAPWVRNGQKEAVVRAVVVTQDGKEHSITLTLKPAWNLRQTLAKNEASLAVLDSALARSPRSYFTLAYGAARRPAPSGQGFSQAGRFGVMCARASAMATLFSPDAALAPFEQFAMDLDDRADAGSLAALTLLLDNMLPGLAFDRIDRARGEALFKTPDGSVPFARLSDSHQTMVAWCGDVLLRISTALQGTKAPLKARGVLLIDGLALNLHPSWQRVLPGVLADTFPNLQLIATSHAPLVAQQTQAGELYVVERSAPSGGAGLRAVQGDPSQLTLNQVMAPLFGVASADSERVQALRSRARTAPSRLSTPERTELAQLSPMDALPVAMQHQLKASAELTQAIAQSSGGAVPELNLEKLRQNMGERISNAALRVGKGKTS